jgi:hypothetical protein
MSITGDVIWAWRAPRALIRSKLAEGVHEGQALALLMGSALLIFLSQWPKHARTAHLDPSVPLDARLGGALLACVFLLPLIAYALAGCARLIARILGRKGSGFGARLALFWALFAISPLMLLDGLLRGLIGAGGGVAMAIFSIGVLAGFFYLWGNMMIGSEV